jgi:sugar/nucleoside kinase (ribokinase family)
LELLALTHQTDTQGRLQELSETVEVVVAKLGPQGAIWAQAGTQTQQPAQVVEVVDTVGAGDAFAAGLLAALADARSVHESLLNATAIAALAVAKRGAQPELS